MKYKLETIPVMNAYEKEAPCPLCFLQRAAEESYVEFFLGNSVMVPEMRVQVNDVGFCPQHYRMLLEGGNRLGLSLITHTHIQDLRKRLEKPRRSLIGASGRGRHKAAQQLGELLLRQRDRCMMCDRMHERFLRYAFTIAYLWEHESEFRETFAASQGVCLGHLPGLLEMAAETLKGKVFTDFVAEVARVQDVAWDRLEAELLAFSGKFDYQATEAATGATKESVREAILKLTGMPTDPP